jgi:hypothetical protein
LVVECTTKVAPYSIGLQSHGVASVLSRDRLDVADDATGICEALDEERLGIVGHGALEIVRRVGIDDARRPPELWIGVLHLLQGAAVEA